MKEAQTQRDVIKTKQETRYTLLSPRNAYRARLDLPTGKLQRHPYGSQKESNIRIRTRRNCDNDTRKHASLHNTNNMGPEKSTTSNTRSFRIRNAHPDPLYICGAQWTHRRRTPKSLGRRRRNPEGDIQTTPYYMVRICEGADWK